MAYRWLISDVKSSTVVKYPASILYLKKGSMQSWCLSWIIECSTKFMKHSSTKGHDIRQVSLAVRPYILQFKATLNYVLACLSGLARPFQYTCWLTRRATRNISESHPISMPSKANKYLHLKTQYYICYKFPGLMWRDVEEHPASHGINCQGCLFH